MQQNAALGGLSAEFFNNPISSVITVKVHSSAVLMLFAGTLALASCSGSKSALPADYIADRDSLSASILHFNHANELSQVPAGASSMQSTTALDTAIVSSLRTGLTAGYAVRQPFLDWLDPDMREAFRHQFLAGQALYLDGLEHQDPQKQLSGNELIKKWYDGYWSTHSDAILDKALAK